MYDSATGALLQTIDADRACASADARLQIADAGDRPRRRGNHRD
jgi:hypothetical protein